MTYYNQSPSTLSAQGSPVVVKPSATDAPVIFGYSPSTSSFPYQGLDAYWKFDGNSNDATGNGHNGTDTNVRYENMGRINMCATTSLDYNGPVTASDGKVVINNQLSANIPTGSFTIAVWISSLSGGGYGTDWSVFDWGNRKARLWVGRNLLSNTEMRYEITSGGNYYTASSPAFTTVWATGRWYHFAYVRENNFSSSMYVDGQPVSVTDTIGTRNPDTGATDQTILSGSWSWGGGWLKFDEMGIWSRALTSAEISLLYNGGYGKTL